ncbi:MAG: hypothetical protein GXP13_00255 [Gammaproteobacteria bacterium]|nr:hypothetical protein [Gammaproteobacteria bacterium]
MATKKAVVKSAVMAKTLESALAGLATICESGGKAVDSRAKDGKKLAASSKRLSKKRATLGKRKKAAAAKLKKDATADNRNALKAVEKELAAVVKESAKVKKAKDANNAELSGLRVSVKCANAYVKGVAAADKVLNKPKKKRRKKK